jgi:uncharacterized protein (DUF2249 family)
VSTANRIDVRTITSTERHFPIFSTCGALGPGEALGLVNDHDPRPMVQQFAARLPGQFDWNHLEQGPGTWRVAITRFARASHGKGQCRGSCGAA